MLWVSRLWMTASELRWNKYETPTPRHSCAWWWNMSESHSYWGRFLVKICNLSGAPCTVFSWWFSLRLLPFELSSSCSSIRESVRCLVNVFQTFPFPVTSGFTVYVLLRWAGTSWTITALDCKCHGALTVNESHQLNMAMYERDVLKYANPSDAPLAAPRGSCICFIRTLLVPLQSCSVFSALF